jgi:type II secretion system protein G
MKLLKFMSKTKFFTLIELIVVIVVLGILAAIVIPNISSLQEEAEHTSIASNVRNLQTSVDMFVLESNGVPPTKERPALGNPQTLEIHALHPEYTMDTEYKGVYWWLDHSHTVMSPR